jgi:hypothetical protein
MSQIGCSLKFAALALCLGTASADAATLRTMTTLHAPVVRLSDLFDDAGAGADRVLGPGPGAGGRIVVEAAQLGAIARRTVRCSTVPAVRFAGKMRWTP